MRIALVHNIANNFFSLSRYFRDLGHDAHLYCQEGYDKWLPQHDDPTAVALDWVHFVDLTATAKHHFSFLRDFDAVICTGLQPARLPAAILQEGIRVHCYIPYGGDITDCLTDFDRDRDFWREHFNALNEIPFIMGGTYEPIVGLLSHLGIPHVHGYPPLVYAANTPMTVERKSLAKKLMIFSPTRHLWVSPQDTPYDFDIYRGLKRNDVLIRAFDKLCRWSRSSHSELYIVNYGPDFSSSLKLIKSLELSASRVRIFNGKLPRSKLFEVLRSADVMANAFRIGAHQFGTGVQEALASGCVVANYVGGIKPEIAGCPILDVADEEELFFGLYSLEQSIELRRTVQQASLHWFNENLGLNAARRFIAALDYVIRRGGVSESEPGALASMYFNKKSEQATYFEGRRRVITTEMILDSIVNVKQKRVAKS